MRLHRLEISAFGPFAGHTVIDFDALTEADVFLLCGDTGAGKSTVLDGVCFALYGDVPSDRGKAHQLHSHFAPPDARPLVVLEASVSGRRLRFSRSPAWQRPKRRGAGLTSEQSRVLVEELEDHEWVPRCTRLDEAGHLVTDLLGMNRDQFAQVALLPQGQFDRFLASASEDRQRLLTQLFRTRRFEEVERWLAERRTQLRREGREHQAQVSARLQRTAEAAAIEPAESVTEELESGDTDEQVRDWVAVVTRKVRGTARLCEQDRSRLEQLAARAAADHDHAVAQQDWRERARSADAVVSRLRESLVEAEQARARVVAARRAAPVAPLVARVASTRAAAASAEHAAAAALRQVGALLEDPEPDEASSSARDRLARITQRVADATERAIVATALLPRAEELAASRLRRDQIDEELAALAVVHDELEVALAADPSIVDDHAARVDTARALAEAVPRLEQRTRTMSRLTDHRADLRELEQTLATARAARQQCARERHDARERHLDLRQRRLDGMAAELAQGLAVGHDCPVCGSDHHPAPARVRPDAASPDDERAAQRRLDDADIALQTAGEEVRGVEARIAVLRDTIATEAGEADPDETVASLAEALAAATTAREGLPDLEAGYREALTAAAEHRRRSAEVAAETVARTTARATVSARVERLTAELGDLLAGEGESPTVDALRRVAAHHAEAAQTLGTAREALEEHRRAERDAEAALLEASLAATAAGLLDLDVVASSVLDEAELAQLEAELHHRDAEEAEAVAVLDHPDAVAALAGPVLDVEAAHRARRAAELAHRESVTRAARAAERREQVVRHVAALRRLLDDWRPVREQLDLVRSVTELAEGKSADNAAQMRLSAYVLAARLAQVVAAANERLGPMTDDRYLLEHTARRAVGDRRGGLSLVVRDQWTDETRDPVTLSGGETFLVSLALALGLADVVTGEAGGARIDTLFVDEGFGSLDPGALELVMDTLDRLREGGRAVGVVSHVPELRSRISTQLVVHKGSSGSWVTQGAGADT